MTEQLEKNLDLLGTLHYVMGAVTALLACIPIIHFTIGIMMLSPGFGGGDPAPRIIAILFIVLSAIIILAGWVFAILIILTGRRLKERRAYNFCLIISFLECLIMPLGTVLGIFTIITLSKEPVKELFN